MKEQHILKCKIAIENETMNILDFSDQNHNNNLDKKVEQLMNTVNLPRLLVICVNH